MGMREKITNAVYDHPGAPAIIDAVMEVVEEEIAHWRHEAAVAERRLEWRDGHVNELKAKLAAIDALHTKVDGGVFVDKCSCKRPWPCPTAQILEDT